MPGSMRMYFRELKNLSRCSSSLNMRWPKVLVMSNAASPYRKPTSLIDTFASLSGTMFPFTYATRSSAISSS